MNERKWIQLFAAARKEPALEPSAELVPKVLRALRDGGSAAGPATPSIFDQLNLLFPRCAWAAAAIIGLSLAVDWGLTVAGVPGLGDGVSQVSAQWFLTPDGF